MQTLLLAAGTVLALFLWQGHQGFNLWDEGFLWYGAQRVMVGEVPIRDFMAYDPGRYYWAAAFMGLWGDDGVMALRGAIAIFQAMGLFIGLALLVRSSEKPNRLLWLLAVVTLVVWMFPRHKLFDISLSIAMVGALSFLVHQPYALFPRGDAFQKAEIERIQVANPGFAMILDLPLDRRDELRFSNTHPMVDQYIRDHFEPLNGYTQNPAYQLYRSRQATR